MSDKPNLDTLPGNKMWQSATLGHLIIDTAFFRQAHQKIRPDWFQDRTHSQIYKIISDIFSETDTVPQLAEIKANPVFDGMDMKLRIALSSSMDLAVTQAAQIRLPQIKAKLTPWLHSKMLQDGMVKATKSWNAGNYSETAALLEDTTRKVRESQFEEGDTVSFANPGDWLKTAETTKKGTVTTGLHILDRALLDLTQAEQTECDEQRAKGLTPVEPGGLQLGDTTVVLAPSNTGKTSTLITVAVHNIRLGKNVLFITHEGRPEDIRMKFFQSMLNRSYSEILDMYKTKEGLSILNAASNVFQEHLIYQPYNKAGMKVEDVVPMIRRLQEECVIRRQLAGANDGRGFDLLVSDYPAKLTTELASRGHLSTRHIHDYVYEQFVQLALEYDFHSLLAIQTNREGSRVNSGQHDDKNSEHRLLTMEDVSESWGPMTSASNVITLNRSPSAKLAGRMTIYVAKSRSSETGLAVVAKTNFASCITHSNVLGAVSYFGTKTMEDKLDGYLSNFKALKDGRIPPEEVFRRG